MVEQQTIDRIAKELLNAAPRRSIAILFGSYARGQAGPDSDLDFLIVEPNVADAAAEMVRLREAVDSIVRPLRIGVDVLVVSADRFEYWRDTPHTVYCRALREGRIYGQVA